MMCRCLMVAACLLVPLAAVESPDGRLEDNRPADGQAPVDVGIDQRLGATIPPEITVITGNGSAVRLGSLISDRPTVLVPAYYECPMLCGLNLQSVHTAASGLEDLQAGKDYRLLAVSFDPSDTPARARSRRDNLVQPQGRQLPWHFTIVDAADQQAFLDAIGWQVERVDGEFAHPAGAVLVTPTGRIARYLHGLDIASDDLRLALVEAGEGTIGSTMDQLLLLCYHYDPAQRQYGFFIANFLRAGALLVMLISGIGCWLLIRRIKRRRALATDTTDSQRAEGEGAWT